MEKEELKRAEVLFDKLEAHILECHTEIHRLKIKNDALERQNSIMVGDIQKLVDILLSVEFLSYQSKELREFIEELS